MHKEAITHHLNKKNIFMYILLLMENHSEYVDLISFCLPDISKTVCKI